MAAAASGKPKVLRSIEADDGVRCVDLFQRPDGSYGFEEYRRDGEDPRGWYRSGSHGARRFATMAAALEQARAAVPWLAVAD